MNNGKLMFQIKVVPSGSRTLPVAHKFFDIEYYSTAPDGGYITREDVGYEEYDVFDSFDVIAEKIAQEYCFAKAANLEKFVFGRKISKINTREEEYDDWVKHYGFFSQLKYLILDTFHTTFNFDFFYNSKLKDGERYNFLFFLEFEHIKENEPITAIKRDVEIIKLES